MTTINNYEKVSVPYSKGLRQKERAEKIYNYLLGVDKTKAKPMADELHMSLQRCSFLLRQLHELGLVKREEVPNGQSIEVEQCYWNPEIREHVKYTKTIYFSDVFFSAVK